MNAVWNPGEAAMAEAGDVTVWIRCGAVMKLDDDLRPRSLTDAEAEELMADREGWRRWRGWCASWSP